MPWKTTNLMNQRTQFALNSLEPGCIFTELCQQYGISTKTGYKWKQRFLEHGLEGMHDQSRKPHGHSQMLSEEVVCELIRLKFRHPTWGARKIVELYKRAHANAPSESSCKRIFERAGLVVKRKRRSLKNTSSHKPITKALQSNDIWTVDFKGWWKTSSGRCEPLTIRDEYSRYLLCVAPVGSGSYLNVRDEFEKVFRTNGLPRLIRSDNGSPFASSNAPLRLSRLSVWWISLGIDIERNRPAHPQDNPAHERMHLDIAREIEANFRGNLDEHTHALKIWMKTFNEQRPHEALNMRLPSEVYQKSERKYNGTADYIVYPKNMIERKVQSNGSIKVYNQMYPLSTSLAGWNVGLRPLDQDHLELFFAQLRLGTIELSSNSVVWADQPTPHCYLEYQNL